MHKKWTIAAFLLCSLSSLAQDASFDRYTIEAQFGWNNPVDPMAPGYDARSLGLMHTGLAGRYMLSPYFGLRLQTAFDRFRENRSSPEFRTDYFRISAEGVVNVGTLLHFYDWTHHIGLLVHGGFGYAVMTGDNGPGKDQMLHGVLGITPQVKLSDRWALSLDFTAIRHVYQTRTYDFSTYHQQRGFDGKLFNLSLGVQYCFGSRTHADWVVPVNATGRLGELEQRMEQLQENTLAQQARYDSLLAVMSDPDGDGVPVYLDQEPASALGATVDTKGVTVPEKMPVPAPVPVTGNELVEFPDKQGLFYSVQVGCYRSAVDLEKLYGLSPLFKTALLTGETRYLYGTYCKLADAQQVKDITFKSGVMDAFVVAYYQGRRIPVEQAERLLTTHGSMILEPAK